MKRIFPLLLFLLFACASARGQCGTFTPNLNLGLPAIGATSGWGTCLNTDLTALDTLLGGFGTLAVNSTTPSVAGRGNWETANTVATAITNFTGGFSGQQIKLFCTDSNTTMASGATLSLSAPFTCAPSKSISLVLLLGVWTEQARSGATGGGGSSVGSQFVVQVSNGAGGFSAGGATDNGTLFTTPDLLALGLNPYIDIRKYGARAVVSVPATTATVSSGSTTVTIPADPGFANGDGLVIYGAGPTNALPTPGAITVTPIVAKGLLGTGEVVASVAGSTTYNYQRIASDKLGALTAASAVGSTTTGQATLGAITVSISSITRTNNVVTVTLASSTPLVPNAAVWILGNADPTFNGAYQVSTTPSGTQFTFASGVDTRDGASTSTSGGTVTYYVGNRLTWTAGTEWQGYIYGRTGGTLTRIGPNRPLENRFDDWGATLMGAPRFPDYVPVNPPVAATNDPLVTTIVSGAGTTTLTVANAASNSVTGATIKFDNAPTIKAAHDAAGGVPIYIPSTSSGTFVVNSYLNLNPFPTPNFANILQAGQLTLNAPLEFEGGMVWKGIGGTGTTATLITQQARIGCNATPCVYDNSPGGTVYVENLALVNPSDQAILWLVEGVSGFNRTYKHMGFVTGDGGINEDYLGISFLARGGSTYRIDKMGAVPNMCNSCVTGLFAPIILMTGNEWVSGIVGGPNPAGALELTDAYVYSKGVNMDPTVANSTIAMRVDGYYTQGPRTPLFTFTQGFAGQLGDLVSIKNTFTDTGAVPLVSNLSVSLGYLYLENVLASSSGQINVTGNPISNLVVNGTTGPIGPTSGLISGPFFTNNFVNVGLRGYFGTILSSPAAPTLATAAGTGQAAGTIFYALTAVDINGNETPLGTPASITLGSASNVNVTPPVLPSGSIGWQPYKSYDGVNYGLASHNHIGGCSVVISAGVSFLDQDAFLCNNHGPLPPLAAQSSMGAQGVSTQALRVMNSGFFTLLDFPTNLTANRNLHVPNATGELALTSLASDGIQYVSANGVDANDGLSPGTAKLTLYSALQALPSGSSTTAGVGTVYVIGTVNYGGPVSGQGMWLMGPGDPNFASPPSGWLKWNPLAGQSLTIDCFGKNIAGAHGHTAGCGLAGGNSTNAAVKLAGTAQIINIRNINHVGNVIRKFYEIGLDSNGGRLLGSTSINLSGVSFGFGNCAAGLGPGIDIANNSFWLWFDNMSIGGCPGQIFSVAASTGASRTANVSTITTTATHNVVTGDTVTITNVPDDTFNGSYVVASTPTGTTFTYSNFGPNNTTGTGQVVTAGAAAINIDPGSGGGSGLIFAENMNLNNGGIRFLPGTNGGSLYVNKVSYEGDFTHLDMPPVLVTREVTPTQIRVDTVEVSDPAISIPCVQVDNGSFFDSDSVVVERVSCGLRGRMHIVGGGGPNNGQTPLRAGQYGFSNGTVTAGGIDVGRRLFSPAVAPGSNLAATDPTTWTFAPGTGSVTNVAAPDGTNNAGRATYASGGVAFVDFYLLNSAAVNVGDIYVFGAWVRSQTANGYVNAAPPIKFALNNNGFGAGDTCIPSITGVGVLFYSGTVTSDGQWQWFSGICKVNSNPTAAGLQFAGIVDATHTVEFYAPVLIKFATGTKSDNEAWEIANNLASFSSGVAAGTVSMLRGQTFAMSTGSSFLVTEQGTLTADRIDTVMDANTSRVAPASLTTTAATTDVVAIQGVTSSSHCTLTPTNATAAADFASTFVLSKTANQITVQHPGSAGRTWDIFCSAN